jgi:purine-cytosine permease-like protein
MKKIIAALLLLSIFITPCYAFTIVDNLVYKKDLVRSNNKLVMVNRFTGEIKYLRRDNGQWIELTGEWKRQYQNMYNAQNKL